MKRFKFITFLLIFTLFISGCVTRDDYTPDGLPLMWRVTSAEGQSIYLFGSYHPGGEGIYPLPSVIMDAFYECDYLAVEVDLNAAMNDIETLTYMVQSTTYLDGRTVADDIGVELYNKAKDVLNEFSEEYDLGIQVEMMSNFKPYMWLSVLTTAAAMKAELYEELGTDMYFLEEAGKHNIEILEIESMQEQLDLLLGLSMPLQSLMIESNLDIDAAAAKIQVIYNAWNQGDERTLETLFVSDEEDALYEEYTRKLITDRNYKMAEAAEYYLAEGMKVFYVVGVGHMVGETGLAQLLAQDGYIVERIK